MSPLFGRSDERAAQDAAAGAEFERLCALPVADLAAEILLAFGPDQERPAHSVAGACVSLMDSQPRGRRYLIDLKRPVQEAIQALEHAGLLVGKVRSGGSGNTQMIMNITRLGETALAEGDVRRYLQAPAQP
jgi:hypothetical protein